MKKLPDGSYLFKARISHLIIAAAAVVTVNAAVLSIAFHRDDTLELSKDEVQVVYDFVSFMDISEIDEMYASTRSGQRFYGEDEIYKVYFKLHAYVSDHWDMSKN